MDDWLIFQYHLIRAQPESRALREPLRGYRHTWYYGSEGGTQEGRSTHAMVVVGQVRRGVPQANPGDRQPRDTMPSRFRRSDRSHAAEKNLKRANEVPVPQTDSGGPVENTEAIERTLVKELGKLPP